MNHLLWAMAFAIASGVAAAYRRMYLTFGLQAVCNGACMLTFGDEGSEGSCPLHEPSKTEAGVKPDA